MADSKRLNENHGHSRSSHVMCSRSYTALVLEEQMSKVNGNISMGKRIDSVLGKAHPFYSTANCPLCSLESTLQIEPFSCGAYAFFCLLSSKKR